MGEYLDLRVHDLVALDEIELYAEVLSAVAASDRPLTAGRAGRRPRGPALPPPRRSAAADSSRPAVG